jgi:hypothetical protein
VLVDVDADDVPGAVAVVGAVAAGMIVSIANG